MRETITQSISWSRGYLERKHFHLSSVSRIQHYNNNKKQKQHLFLIDKINKNKKQINFLHVKSIILIKIILLFVFYIFIN